MIVLKNNRRIFWRSLFYKVLYFFTKPNNLVLYEYFSYKNILLLISVVFTQKKEKILIFLPNFEEEGSFLTKRKLRLLYRVNHTLYWRFLREDRHFNYYNLRLLQYYGHMHHILYSYFVNFTRIFYNSFFKKTLFLKTYNIYKSVHLAEFLVKFYFNFENNYFLDFKPKYITTFKLYDEFLQIPYFLKENSTAQNNPIEFIIFKKNFFKNDLYAFFLHRSAFYFPLKNSFNCVDYQGFEKHQFVQRKYEYTHSILAFSEKKRLNECPTLILYPFFEVFRSKSMGDKCCCR